MAKRTSTKGQDLGTVPTVWYFLCVYFITIVMEIFSVCLKITFRGRRGRERMVVGFIATYAISAYHL
jgi:hypothetical protein